MRSRPAGGLRGVNDGSMSPGFAAEAWNRPARQVFGARAGLRQPCPPQVAVSDRLLERGYRQTICLPESETRYVVRGRR